jgi:hypothetical protein
MGIMNLETRKLNLINWIYSIQEADTINKVEKIQKEKGDWWDNVSAKDKEAINKGIEQLDHSDFITRTQVKKKINEKFKF